jgi:hypothetical protein
MLVSSIRKCVVKRALLNSEPIPPFLDTLGLVMAHELRSVSWRTILTSTQPNQVRACPSYRESH